MALSKSVKKILVVYKQTAFEEFKKRKKNLNLSESAFEKKFPNFMQAHRDHSASLEKILNILKKYPSFKIHSVPREKFVKADGYELVISIGGDGTFLRASHGVDHQLMMGVNSAPRHSVGALCCSSLINFEQKIQRIANQDFTIKLVNRLQVKVNQKILRLLALNDVLFANYSPAGTSRYLLKIGQSTEEQKSSGVWISTAAGSTAAILAAGGKTMPRLSKKIQYLVREPYRQLGHKLKLKRGFVPPKGIINILVEMNDACLFIDGPDQSLKLHFGDTIEICNSANPLRIIS